MPNTREKLIELLADVGLCHYNTIADHLIANGVTIPVRCKGCSNYEETMGKDSGKPCGYGRCLHTDGLPGIVFDELFCSYGERRNDV